MNQLKEIFHLYKTKKAFEDHLNMGIINPDSICFIEETKEIFTQGNYYSIDSKVIGEILSEIETIKDSGALPKEPFLASLNDITHFIYGPLYDENGDILKGHVSPDNMYTFQSYVQVLANQLLQLHDSKVDKDTFYAIVDQVNHILSGPIYESLAPGASQVEGADLLPIGQEQYTISTLAYLLSKDIETLSVDLQQTAQNINTTLSSHTTDIQNINNVLYKQYSTVSIGVFPSIIEKGVLTDVSVNFTFQFNSVNTTPDKFFLYRDSSLVLTVTGLSSVAQPYKVDQTTEFKIKATYKGITKENQFILRAYYPRYYGCSTKTTLTEADIFGFTKQPITSNASGTYNINVAQDNYVWLCVPQGMRINTVKSGGFDAPFNEAITVNTSKGNYLCYRSASTYNAGNFNCVIA